MDPFWAGVLWAIGPTIIVTCVFFYILRGIVRMDRTERKVYARMEKEERQRRGMPSEASPRAHAGSQTS